ncbi:uncharacterized protein [Prorops nasuta]|uniref:uncharacterized protein n=1 Tax=Prorops nasuta TaxID=863751 RepID=UPI0034CDCC02
MGVRPISLSSCLCKTFERMIQNRLQWWIEIENILPETQSGFRSNRSVTDNLIAMTIKIQESFSKNKDLLACFLDINSAFDNVIPSILFDKLAEIGCPSNLVKFVNFLINDRKVYFFNSFYVKEEEYRSFKGLPQGGVLSPLLYIIYVKDIMKNIDPNVFNLQFADDIAIYSPVSFSSSTKRKLQSSIRTVQQNLLEFGLKLAPHKSILVHFNNKNIPPGISSITIGSDIIKSSPSVKFLGIIFDYKLSFKDHIDYIISIFYKRLNIIKFISSIRWGSDPDTLLVLYKSYIRSLIEYNSFLFYPKNPKLALSFERLQFAAIRIILGLRISTPTNILIGESKLLTIKERSLFLGKSYLTKRFASKGSLTYHVFTNFNLKYINFILNSTKTSQVLLLTSLVELLPLFKTIIDYNYLPTTIHDYSINFVQIPIITDLGLQIKSSPYAKNIFLDHYMNRAPGTITIFTDGSKLNNNNNSNNSGGVGAALVSPELDAALTFKLENEASIFTAECFALLQATKLAVNQWPKQVHIYSDSLSAIVALNTIYLNKLKTHPFLREIKEIIYNNTSLHISRHNNINFFYIPGHKEIPFNEKADRLAKEAALSNTVDPSDLIRIPFTDLKPFFRSQARHNDSKLILTESNSKGTAYFKYFYKQSSRPWFSKVNLPRKLITFTCRIRSDHYHLNSSLQRIGFILDGGCQCGFNKQDIDHVLWNCTIFEEGRQIMTDALRKKGFSSPYYLSSFLEKPNLNALQIIFKFIMFHNLCI